MKVIFGPSWGAWALHRRIARLELQEAVFVNRTFRRIAAPSLDARRRLLGRAPMWER